jgi:hypothetical protein
MIFLFSTIKQRTIQGLMLMKANGRGYLPKKRVYDNRVSVIRHYIGLYGLIRETMYILLNKCNNNWF